MLELLPYGGAIYWLLLFLMLSIITVLAISNKPIKIPIAITVGTILSIFMFTDFQPNWLPILMGTLTYFMAGAAYAVYRWIRLVYKISFFTQNAIGEPQHIQNLFANSLRAGEVMRLPPHPCDFKEQLWSWFLFWPAFSLFFFLDTGVNLFNHGVARFLTRLSERVYDSKN